MKQKIISRIFRRILSVFFTICFRFRNFLELPGMTSKEIKILKKIFRLYEGKKLRVLEWGCGRSTTYYARYLKSLGVDFVWYGVNNSKEWYENVHQQIKKNNLMDQVHLSLFEFDPFWMKPGWDWKNFNPKGFEPQQENEKEYICFPETVGGRFDVIIVDGRFRRRCLIEAKKISAPNGWVVLHDAHKERYHSSLSSYRYGKFIESGFLYHEKYREKAKLWVGSNDVERLPV